MLTTLVDSSSETLAAIAEEKRIRQTNSLVLMFSMGSQFDHLIVQQLAKIGVFCLVADPAKIVADDVKMISPNGMIISGGPASVYGEPPPFDDGIFDPGIPVLGICLGFQMWAKYVGAQVVPGEKREFHSTALSIRRASPLFEGIGSESFVLQSHGDVIRHLDASAWKSLGHTENAPVAAAQWGDHLFGVQFHPEVSDSVDGPRMFENFCGLICGIKDRFPAHDVAARKIEELREQTEGKKVLIALSGGSDSSVVAHLLRHAMGGDKSRLRGVYIKGIDRPDDEADLLRFFGNQDWIDVKIVDATEEFIKALEGITDPELKRMAMRGVYVQILEREVVEFGADVIVHGTLYTDEVESGHGHATGARRAVIKIHHNVGLKFSVPELKPIADCVKDNARDIGRDIGVPEELLTKHPFPGPGLVVRVEGEITAERLAIARAADGIVMHELRAAGLYQKIWQAGARVTMSRHTTTKGDDGGSGYLIMWFAVSSVNGFTSRPYRVPDDVRERIADRLGNEIREVGAVSYRDSGKPCATIEGE
jgi:GMP synthase (glutamine-hydrolysing)